MGLRLVVLFVDLIDDGVLHARLLVDHIGVPVLRLRLIFLSLSALLLTLGGGLACIFYTLAKVSSGELRAAHHNRLLVGVVQAYLHNGHALCARVEPLRLGKHGHGGELQLVHAEVAAARLPKHLHLLAACGLLPLRVHFAQLVVVSVQLI